MKIDEKAIRKLAELLDETGLTEIEVAEGDQVRRRRECPRCNARFTTYEAAELLMPPVVKRDGRRESFLEEKLRTGLLRALEAMAHRGELVPLARGRPAARRRRPGLSDQRTGS